MKKEHGRARGERSIELTAPTLAAVAGGAGFGRLPGELRADIYARSVENNPRGVVTVFGRDYQAKYAYDKSTQVNTRGEPISAFEKEGLWNSSRSNAQYPGFTGTRAGWEYGRGWDYNRTP